jgi:hypothetical protein
MTIQPENKKVPPGRRACSIKERPTGKPEKPKAHEGAPRKAVFIIFIFHLSFHT